MKLNAYTSCSYIYIHCFASISMTIYIYLRLYMSIYTYIGVFWLAFGSYSTSVGLVSYINLVKPLSLSYHGG